MSPNLIMIDSAPNDPRSASAMLRGCGDGREQTWLFFEKKHTTLSQEEIMEKFRLDVRYGRVRIKNQSTLNLSNKWLAALIAFLIIVA
jgi:hypothetical protein